MKKTVSLWALVCVCLFAAWQFSATDISWFKNPLVSPAHAQFNGCLPGLCNPPVLASGGGGNVAFDQVSAIDIASGVATNITNATGISQSGLHILWTHTPVGTPSAVAVLCTNYEAANNLSSVTYGGNSMTIAGAKQTFGTRAVYIYGLANPLSGAQQINLTYSATGTYGTCGAITVTGSDTTTTFRASSYATATGTSANPSVGSLVNNAGDLIIDIVSTGSWGETFTVVSPQTQRWNDSTQKAGASSTLPATASTMQWTLSGSDTWGIASVAFKHS